MDSKDAAKEVIHQLMGLHNISIEELVASDEAELEAMTNEDDCCAQTGPCGYECCRKLNHDGAHVAVSGIELYERWM